MGLGVLVFALQKLRGYLPEHQVAESWHEARLFTDPWYHPRDLLRLRLVIDLTARPPVSAQAVWFLSVAAMSVVVPMTSKRVSLEETYVEAASEEERSVAPRAVSAFRDPWFVVPGAVLGAVEVARFGRDRGRPNLKRATWWLLAPLLGMAFAAAMPLVDQ